MHSIEKLITAYTNEKATAILLPYDTIVDDFNSTLRALPANTADESSLLATFKEIETERIRYFTKEYILVRLDKIRHNLFVDTELMSVDERLFAQKYRDLMVKYTVYTERADDQKAVVGFIAQRKIEGVKIDDQVVEIHPGDFFIASYDEVIHYIKDGSITLV